MHEMRKSAGNLKRRTLVRGPDRLPDPEQIREGAVAITNITREELPKEYLNVVEDVLPLPESKYKNQR
jgi:hypothetical protein